MINANIANNTSIDIKHSRFLEAPHIHEVHQELLSIVLLNFIDLIDNY
jgi:hypothetical protein